MSDPLLFKDDLPAVIDAVARAAKEYLAGLDDLPVVGADAAAARERLPAKFPERGEGSMAPLRALIDDGLAAATNSGGPRFFHFVIGGVTPAALGADWLTSLIDQNGALWPSSPLSGRLEQTSIRWLLELFDLPLTWGGTLTPSATYANFAGLAVARSWWAERHGTDAGADGLAGLPPVPIFSSGYLHMSARKALSMLGMGRDRAQTFAKDATGARTVFRPAIVNWRTTAGDVDALIDVVLELSRR